MEQRISVVSDVKNVGELLGGASIEAARFVPIGGRLRLELELLRACPELQTVEKRGFLSRPKTPWAKSRLVLNQIKDVEVQRAAEGPAGQVPLIVCEAIPGGYQVVVTAPDGLRLQMTLDQLDGQFADLGAPIQSS